MVDDTPLNSVARTFRILEFIRDSEPVSLTDIANEMSLPKSTAHRYLTTLREYEYVVRDADEYRISCTWLEFANRVRTREPTYSVIHEKTREIARETGELVQFVIEENDRAVFLFEEAGERGISVGSYARTFRPLHSTASGKAILSTWDHAAVRAYAEQTGLERITTNTITDVSTLLEELDRVQERGYATNEEENVEGLSAVAAPITRTDGGAAGALTISGPANRISTDTIDGYLPLLLDTKNEIELNFSLL